MRAGQNSIRVARVRRAVPLLAAVLVSVATVQPLWGQGEPSAPSRSKVEGHRFQGRTTQEYNRRLEQLRQIAESQPSGIRVDEYRIGPEDLLEITVFEAPELNRSLRVSASGEISLPLLGGVPAAGLTPRELELALQERFRSYLKDPHIGVFVRELESHLVSVVGAVKKPGVFRIRGAKTVLEMLSMAEGLAEDAGDTVVVMRSAGLPAAEPPAQAPLPASGTNSSPAIKADQPEPAAASREMEPPSPGAVEINLKRLLESGDSRYNLAVYAGDIVKVTRAGIVYVVGEVRKPGGFLLKSNENISVLQALALAEGLTRTSAKSHARIIRTQEGTGERTEISIDLGKILAGRAQDPILRPKDIVFVPNSAARSGVYRGAEAALSVITGVIIFRR